MVREEFDFPSESTSEVMEQYRELKELGDCHAAVGEHDEARDCYEQACRIAPEEAGAYVGLGVLAMQSEQSQDARRAFDIARHLDPNCSEAYGGLAMIHHQNESHAAAFEMYLKCLEINPDNLMALLGLFQTSCQMGTFSKIIYYLDIYLKHHPDDTAVLFCLATLHARDGQFEKSGKALRRILELEPNKVEAAKLLAQVTDNLARRRPQQATLA